MFWTALDCSLISNSYFVSKCKNNYIFLDYMVWIGMTDAVKEGVWRMTGTDKIVPFFDWYPGEPQNKATDPNGQDCAAFYSHGMFKWADINCSTRTAFVACEKTKQI
jgi:hypothetical protein